MFDLIKKLTAAFGVSGNEENIRNVILDEIKDCVDEVQVDVMGNLIAIKKGTGKKIMLAAHMDEIGVMATYIDGKGFIRFSNVGWVSQFYALGQRIRFKNGTKGTIFYEEKIEEMKDLKLSRMYIDIGAKNREDAEEKVKIGDVACFEGEAVMQNGMITSKALDNRAGCAVLVDIIKNMPSTHHEIYFVFTVQEELGLRGAKTSAFNINPDIAIAVDVTDTGDTPEGITMEVKCGGGPAIKIKDSSIICHPQIKNLLINSAKTLDIQYQLEILERGGNDTGAIHLSGGGVPSGAISLPCRYIHSPVETVSIKDVKNASKLLSQALIQF